MNISCPFSKKGDLRRTLLVLAAINEHGGATLVQIVKRTGIEKRSVTSIIDRAIEQAGVVITKTGATYRLSQWGELINKTGAEQLLRELDSDHEQRRQKEDRTHQSSTG